MTQIAVSYSKIKNLCNLLYLSAARGHPVRLAAGSLHSARVKERLAGPSDRMDHISINTDLFLCLLLIVQFLGSPKVDVSDVLILYNLKDMKQSSCDQSTERRLNLLMSV